MGCAMIAIMLFHQPFFYGNYFVDFFHLFGVWGVEIFLFVSGFGIVHSLERNSLKRYYFNRIQRILPSCLIVGIGKLFLCSLGFRDHTPSNYLLLVTNIYLWYIYAIMIYYTISPFLLKIIKQYGLIIVIIASVFSLSCKFVPFEHNNYYLINHLGWVTARLPIYILGMYFAIKPIKFKIYQIFTIGLLFFLLCMILQIGSTMVKYKLNIPYMNILLLFSTPMLCLFCSYIKTITSQLHLNLLFESAGKYSLELYLWHGYIYWNIYRIELFRNSLLKCILALSIIIILVIITSRMKTRILKLITTATHV